MIICLIIDFFEMEAFNAQCFLDAVVRKQRQKKQSHHANQGEARNTTCQTTHKLCLRVQIHIEIIKQNIFSSSSLREAPTEIALLLFGHCPFGGGV